MRTTMIVLLGAVLVGVLAACSTRVVPNPGVLRVSPTPIVTTDPSAVAVATLVPARTPIPTATPLATPSLPTPIPQLETTAIASDPTSDWEFKLRLGAPIETDAGARYYVWARLYTRPNREINYLLLDEWRPYAPGYTVPRALGWSHEYFYYTNAPVVDGCTPLVNGGDLWQVRLSDGEQTQLRPDVGRLVSYALSPDGLTLLQAQGGTLTRIDLATLSEVQAGVDEAGVVGPLVWSSDGTRLVAAVVYDACVVPGWRHSIIAVDPRTLAVTELLPPDERRFVPVAYPAPQLMTLVDASGVKWQFNPQTGTLRVP